MTCKEWLEFGINVSGKIFDAAVIGFRWGKTFDCQGMKLILNFE